LVQVAALSISHMPSEARHFLQGPQFLPAHRSGALQVPSMQTMPLLPQGVLLSWFTHIVLALLHLRQVPQTESWQVPWQLPLMQAVPVGQVEQQAVTAMQRPSPHLCSFAQHAPAAAQTPLPQSRRPAGQAQRRLVQLV
jgi:hypothetical protein